MPPWHRIEGVAMAHATSAPGPGQSAPAVRRWSIRDSTPQAFCRSDVSRDPKATQDRVSKANLKIATRQSSRTSSEVEDPLTNQGCGDIRCHNDRLRIAIAVWKHFGVGHFVTMGLSAFTPTLLAQNSRFFSLGSNFGIVTTTSIRKFSFETESQSDFLTDSKSLISALTGKLENLEKASQIADSNSLIEASLTLFICTST